MLNVYITEKKPVIVVSIIHGRSAATTHGKRLCSGGLTPGSLPLFQLDHYGIVLVDGE